ncbi:Leucoanthocyanidin dioxygenase [Acorus gramineus]|uniref:Leucoanthocyanidin dioxygenase n=1 Tax=Acorus gramineus TaxID=55184 RepID=A0AAV9AYW7_ACOGR|nr:Leucoanthocyanidin dioxygenase [Acorus gramineus]
MEVHRVQALAESGLSQVPPQYIQPTPSLRTTSSSSVPLIDLSSSTSSSLLRHIPAACKDWGAFQLVNHGVPDRLLDSIRSVGLGFFGSPIESRERFACDPRRPASEGYGSKMLSKSDVVLDWRDYFDHHTLPLSRRDPDQWPDFPPNYREVIVEYSEHMKVLAQKLLGIISRSLGLGDEYTQDAVGEVYQNITISYYPACPQPELVIGLQPHSDMGAITLLVQDDVGGLEVLKDGEWVLVEPLKNAIVVILADQMEIISNGQYISAQHRATVNTNRARLSIATFYDPSKSRKIFPAPKLVKEGSPARYREVVYGDYVSSWYGTGPDGRRNLDALLIQP